MGLKLFRALLVIVAGCLGALACRSGGARQTPAVDESPARTTASPPPASPTASPTPLSFAARRREIERAVNEALAGVDLKAAAVVLSVSPRAIVALGQHGADPTKLTLRPGSTVKPLLAFGAAEASLLKPGTKLTCTGAYGPLNFKCHGKHGAVTMPEAIATSCNAYFFELADRLGYERTSRTFERFGFGRETGLSKAEAAGRLPSAEWLRSKQEPETRGELWKGWVLEVGSGHGPLEVTLLQLAVAYAQLGEALAERVTGQAATSSVRAEILEGLRRAVRDPNGTGHLAHVPGIDIAGKTGSAEAGTFGDDSALARPDNAWFVGYAPAAAPEVVVAVVVLEGEAGGKSAAPLARKIFSAWFTESAR